jgi:hypothetical protein
LVDSISEGGIGTCAALCQLIPNSVGQVICDLACVGVGFDAFTMFLNDADLDPIYVCAETFFCPKNDCNNNCTTITSVTVTPAKAKVRTTFTFTINVHAQQASGTGLTVSMRARVRFACDDRRRQILAINCPLCNQNGVIEMADLVSGYTAGQDKQFNITLDTAEGARVRIVSCD